MPLYFLQCIFVLAANYFNGIHNHRSSHSKYWFTQRSTLLMSGDPLHVIHRTLKPCHRRHRSEFVNMKKTPYFNFWWGGLRHLTVVYKFAHRNQFGLLFLRSLPLAVQCRVTVAGTFRCTRLIRNVIWRWFVFVFPKVLLSFCELLKLKIFCWIKFDQSFGIHKNNLVSKGCL